MQLVTSELRSIPGYAPPEALQPDDVEALQQALQISDSWWASTNQPVPARDEAHDESKPSPKKAAEKAEKRAQRRAVLAAEAAAHRGMPTMVHGTANVKVAVLPRDEGPRLQAPARADLSDFVQQHLYGGRHDRRSALTQASLKPKGPNGFGAAINFARAPLDPVVKKARKGKRERKEGGPAPGGGFVGERASTLEQMAARIMRKRQHR